jgi:hypothetical protein
MTRIFIACVLFAASGIAAGEDLRLAMGDLVGRWTMTAPSGGVVVYEFTMNGLMVEETPGNEELRRYYLDEGRLMVHEGVAAERQWRVVDKSAGRLVLTTPANQRLELSRVF